MKNPNGYGCIKRLSGNRRRPFAFCVTADGQQKPIAYFATHTEALIYQVDYGEKHQRHRLSDCPVTFSELYHRWMLAHIERTAPSVSAINGYKASYKHCRSLWDMPINSIKYEHVQQVADRMARKGLSYSTRKKARSLISLVYKYGRMMELTSRDFSRLISIGRNKKVRPHKPFSRQKINLLWQCSHPMTDTVLILIYTGMRVGELLALAKSDINRKQKYLSITKSKTAAGIRIIPIHTRIWPLIDARLSSPGKCLICDADGMPYTYGRYTIQWRQIMKLIRAEDHRTHDCRHTCATLLDNAEANDNAERRILGHATGDVTDKTYTHKDLRQLRKAISKLR